MTTHEAISLRLAAHFLSATLATTPEEVVSWMGAMQAQDLSYFKWAIGMRTTLPGRSHLQRSLAQGHILRLHLLRCTVQAVTPQDLPWMRELCRERNLRTIQSWPSYNLCEQSAAFIQEGTEALREILSGGKSLHKKALCEAVASAGLPADTAHINQLILHGEIEGTLCSGEPYGNEHTWALASERTAPHSFHSTGSQSPQPPTQTAALARLATKYFRSHSPATFEDFCWWTGLTKTLCRKALEAIATEVDEVAVAGHPMYVHHDTQRLAARLADRADILTASAIRPQSPTLLLPPYDEYLVGYKSRWLAIGKPFEAMAYNKFGIFRPVILHHGRVVGYWRTSWAKDATTVQTELFTKHPTISTQTLARATLQLQQFCSQ